MLDLLLGLFRLIWRFGKGHHAVVLENLALLQQIAVYKRRKSSPNWFAGTAGSGSHCPSRRRIGGKPCASFIRTRWCVGSGSVSADIGRGCRGGPQHQDDRGSALRSGR